MGRPFQKHALEMTVTMIVYNGIVRPNFFTIWRSHGREVLSLTARRKASSWETMSGNTRFALTKMRLYVHRVASPPKFERKIAP